MEPFSKTYNPQSCCGANCWALNHNKGQCWGNVEVIDSLGDYLEGGEIWIHACQGHKNIWQNEGGKYIPEP